MAQVAHAQPGNFTVDKTEGCGHLEVTFTPTDMTRATYKWDFGNTNSSTLQVANATYTSPGTYTVTLTTTGAGGPTTETKVGYIKVYAFPAVRFSFDKNTGCAPLGVKFTDESSAGSGTIANWTWTFGDGQQSTDANPSHLYETSGGKTVSLTIKNSHGCERTDGTVSAITVLGPKADFSVNQATFCTVPASVEFNNNSIGDAPLTYSWDFKDGGNSTAEDPLHDYQTAGLFAPVLTVTDKNGCSAKKTGQIRTGGEGGLTVTASKTKVCVGEQVNFNVVSDAPINSYDWDLGNNTTSASPNPTISYATDARTYTVTLRAQLVGKNCASVVSVPIEVPAKPKPNFTYSSTCARKVTFTSTSTGASRVEWLIDDLSMITLNSFSLDAMAAGSHKVTIRAYNALGCPAELVSSINVAPDPVASFTPDGQTQSCADPLLSLFGCEPFTVNFVSPLEAGLKYEWTFSDAPAGTPTVKTPTTTRTFAKGTHLVLLKITNAQGCVDTEQKIVKVSNVTPVAKFSVPKREACAKEQLSFADESSNADYWCWDFGDGSKGTGQFPTHAYEKPGTYSVTLTAMNGGCTSSYTLIDVITIKKPFVDFLWEKRSCQDPYTIDLQNLSTDADIQKWDFGDGSTSTDPNEQFHTYTDVGSHTITLVGKSTVTGCEVKAEKSFAVYDIKAEFDPDIVNPCIGSPVTFTDKSESASSWSWIFEGRQPDPKDQNRHQDDIRYMVPGNYNVTLVATDPDDCTDSKTVVIEVLDIIGAFTFSGVSDCQKMKATFLDQSTATPSIDEWEWDFGDPNDPTRIAYDKNTIPGEISHTYTKPDLYKVILTLKNGNGTCKFVKDDAVPFTVPEVDFKADKPGNCIDVPIRFSNLSYNALTYKWVFGNGQSSTETHPRLAYGATGEYQVELSATDQYGCTPPAKKKPAFISITKPVADFEILNPSTKCPKPGLTPSFVDKSVGLVTGWAWDSGNGQQASNPSPHFYYSKPGEFDVSLTAIDVNGCTDKVVQPKAIFVGGPSGTFRVDKPGPYCVNDSVTFTAETKDAVSLGWDFADGVRHEQPEMNAGHRYTNIGTFRLAVIMRDAQEPPCELPADGIVELQIQDTAKLDFKFASCVFTNEESIFEVTEPEDDVTYTWSIDGQAAGTGAELPATIDSPGNHSVVLSAMTPWGCPSELAYDVPVQGDVVFVPNVFTPNGDDLNSEFQVLGVERSTWDLKVFDRWGGPVFEQRDYDNSWKANGIATGVYYYLLKNAICPGREYKGVISVIR